MLVLVVVLSVVVGYAAVRSFAAGENVTVNFGTVQAELAPGAFSGTISTYGSEGGSIVASAEQRTALSNLGLKYYRVPLRWNGGSIISSAGGGPTNISGDTWVSNIKAAGGQPMIVLGGSEDNNFTPSEAASMVQHFNGAGGSGGTSRVNYWVVGNEPGNGGMSIGTYCTLFNASYDAMKAVDPTIKVAGPAWAFFDANTMQSFLNCAGSKVDVIDYHHYGMGTTYLDNATALAQTGTWETEVNQTKAMIAATVPARASQIEVQVGEYNWSWRTGDGYPGYNGDDRFYQGVATVWAASVAGHIARAGGRGHQYSDQNGALGLTFEKNADASHFGQAINDPMPLYRALGMFTGGGQFRAFGLTMVQASTTLPNVEVYASRGEKSVVLINKGAAASQAATVALNGVAGGTAEVWQTNQSAPFAAPTKVATAVISAGMVSVTLPAYSVTTLVINDSGATPTPSATPAAPDLNGDGKVNVFDLSILLSHWGAAGAGDIDANGVVNVFDLSRLLSAWTG